MPGHPPGDRGYFVKSVTFSFTYERKEELIGALISAFGGSERKVISGRSEMVGWRDDNGMWMVLKTTIDPRNGASVAATFASASLLYVCTVHDF